MGGDNVALSDEDVTSVLDYLGRQQPVSAPQLSLISGGGGGAVTAPVSAPGFTPPPGAPPPATPTPSDASSFSGSVLRGGPSDLALAAQSADVLGKGVKLAQNVVGGPPSNAAALAGDVPLNQTITPDPTSQMSATDVLRENLPPGGEPSDASAFSSDLGTVGGGAGVLSGVLSLIGSETGDRNLSEAAKAASALAGGTSLAATGVNLAETGGTLAAEGAGAGVGAAAGAAFAPITAMMLASTISGLLGGEDPVGQGIGEMLAGTPHYAQFVSDKLQPNERTQGIAFQALQDALPYVQSQEQLGNLINTMRQYVTTNTGIDLPPGADPFTLAAIPGVGPRTHGQATTPLDWTGRTQSLQGLVNLLKGQLPEHGGGGVEQLWNQFLTRNVDPSQAPLQVTKPDGSVAYMTPTDYTGWYNQQAEPALAAGGALPVPGFMEGVIGYGQPGYNYAGAGLLAPGATPGPQSEAWRRLLAALQGQGGGGAAPPATPAAAAAPTGPAAAAPPVGSQPLQFGGGADALGFANELLATG